MDSEGNKWVTDAKWFMRCVYLRPSCGVRALSLLIKQHIARFQPETWVIKNWPFQVLEKYETSLCSHLFSRMNTSSSFSLYFIKGLKKLNQIIGPPTPVLYQLSVTVRCFRWDSFLASQLSIKAYLEFKMKRNGHVEDIMEDTFQGMRRNRIYKF